MITIGVFDSGFGGLTVLRALLPLIPSARYVYLGDTARLPYGSKSRETIARYAVSSARFLLDRGADLLVIACNTATALALEDIRAAAAPTPVIGVIAPGANAASNACLRKQVVILSEAKNLKISHMSPETSPQVLVLATTATVQSHAYTAALARLGLSAIEKACPLLVPLVEEGWIDHPVTREVVRIYLVEALAGHPSLTTLLLGCTHYPLLRQVFADTLATFNRPLTLIDSAEATAHAVLAQQSHPQASPLNPGDPSQDPGAPSPGSGAPSIAAFPRWVGRKPSTSQATNCTFFATDSIEKFQRLGSHFLGQPLPEVHLVDLGG